MAGTAKRFNRVLQKEINVHAAWLPVANNFQLGDYGVISDGVFAKLGNISEFGVTDVQRAKSNSVQLDFSSEGTRTFKLVGDVEVDALPDSDIEAKVVTEFSKADSFLLKASIDNEEIQNLAQVARALDQASGWKRKYRVVNAIHTGKDCLVISTREANSKVELSGKASALQQLDLGAVEAGISFSKTKQLGLEVVGESGVVGLGLFKLGFGGSPNILAAPSGGEVPIEKHQDWNADLPDDV